MDYLTINDVSVILSFLSTKRNFKMNIREERDRIIWALTNDLAFLTNKDRVFLADFLDTNLTMDMPKGSWITIMGEYDYKAGI